MPTYLDDQPVTLDGRSLKQLLDAAREELARRHTDAEGARNRPPRVVVEILLDGEKLDPDTLAARSADDMTSRELRLTTADPAALAVDSLEQVRGRLADASTLQKQAAELLQQDRPQEGYEKIAASVAAWLQVQQAVLHAPMLLGLNLDQLEVAGRPAHACTQEALEQLQNVKELLERQDPVGLSDALAYEWPELTDRWFELIDALIEKIEGR